MNAHSTANSLAASSGWKQTACGLLLGLGLASPAYAVGDGPVAVAGWSIALVVVIAVGYFFGRKKQ